MQVTVNIPYEQLVGLIRHLPANQIARLKSDLENTVTLPDMTSEKTDFQKLLLQGPVMSDDQYAQFNESRKRMNQWRRK